jgi:hypothetical protein
LASLQFSSSKYSTKKRFHALKFHATNEGELKWSKAEMAREANQFSVKQEWETLPKTGAGSEFNRDNKELSRRKKFGWATKTQSADDLPWLLTFKDENSKERQYGEFRILVSEVQLHS